MRIAELPGMRAVTMLWGNLKGGGRHRFDFDNVLGTSLEVQVVARNGAAARSAERVLLEEIDRLTEILSTYTPASEIARWLGTFECDAVVSPELAEVLALAEFWRVRTRGAFNPAAPAVASARDVSDVLDENVIAEALRPLWAVDVERSVVRRLTKLSVSLDAIAKGYIVSRGARAVAERSGVTNVLVNLGGDIQHFGDTPAAIGIADPTCDAENSPPLSVVRIRNEAIATSGGYRRGRAESGEWRSHLIDPRTGMSARRVASASVIAPDCATADALSTAFSVLDPVESLEIAESLAGIGCLIVDAGGVVTNSEWNNRALPLQR
jgi:thiamine biosynthesis lipoprotein